MRGRRGEPSAIGRAGVAIVAVGMALAYPGCGGGEPAPDDPSKRTIALKSPAFIDGGMIPGEFTCDGAGSSPPLEWSGVPREVRELSLIVEDP